MAQLSESGKQVAQILPGRRERRKAETREKLFRTAMRLFAERGLSDTTTEDITEAADVGLGTFFNYFPSKHHVLTVLSEKQSEKVNAARHHAETGTTSIHEVLQDLMHALAEEPGKSQALARSLFTGFISNEQVREMTREGLAKGRAHLAAIMSVGQERGEVRLDRDATALAMAFQRNVLGTLLLWAIQLEGGNLHDWLDETFNDFWAAVENRENLRRNKERVETSKERGKLQRTRV